MIKQSANGKWYEQVEVTTPSDTEPVFVSGKEVPAPQDGVVWLAVRRALLMLIAGGDVKVALPMIVAAIEKVYGKG